MNSPDRHPLVGPLVDLPVAVLEPGPGRVPLLIDSPHSGINWPAGFNTYAPDNAVLSTWDAWVDELWSDCTDFGAAFVHARFPRAYIDVNRAEYDIDPEIIAGVWPHALAPSPYSNRGMGLIRRFALPGVPMYSAPLGVAEVEHRIATCYRPYRDTLRTIVSSLHNTFGRVMHINCHSMKSRGNDMNVDSGSLRPDIVVSDRDGATASPAHTEWIAGWFRDKGLSVKVNDPYKGGDIVQSFGDPAAGRHSIQIELNRGLYMDESAFSRLPGPNGFDSLKSMLRDFVGDLSRRMATDTAGRVPGTAVQAPEVK